MTFGLGVVVGIFIGVIGVVLWALLAAGSDKRSGDNGECKTAEP